MSYASKVGQQGQPKARFIDTKVGTKRIKAPMENQPTRQHLENVWRFRLKGQGAYTFPTVNIGHHLLKEKIIPSLAVWEEAAYYQLGNPAERYVAFSPDADIQFRHGKELQVEFIKGQKGYIRIEDVSIKDNRVIITNVAPTTSSTWMQQMLTEAELNPYEQ